MGEEEGVSVVIVEKERNQNILELLRRLEHCGR